MRSKPKIAQKCSQLATLNGLTQAELARRLEIKPSNLNHYLRGHGDVHADLFISILKELGIDIEEIVNRELARLNGLSLEEKSTPGAAMEAVAKALPREDRKAMVSFIVKMAQVNLGARAKPHARVLKGWVQ